MTERKAGKQRAGKTADRPAPEPVIYAGPRVGLLRPGMTFVERPAFLDRYIEQCPAIEQLLLPAAEWLQRRAEVAQRASALWFAAQAVVRAAEKLRN